MTADAPPPAVSTRGVAPPHVFVGGTGRSGTTVTAQVLGATERYAFVPFELRVHVAPAGLLDLVRGHSTPAIVAGLLQGLGYRREVAGRVEGLHRSIPEPQHRLLVARFLELASERPKPAVRRYLAAILQRLAEPKQAAVEHSPENARSFDVLAALFPTAKLVLALRDGRDVAASVVPRAYGPRDLLGALRWWGVQVQLAHDVATDLPVHVVRLEELVERRREETAGQLARAVGLDDAELDRMRTFQDTNVTAAAAHIGRWKAAIDEDRHAEVRRVYGGILRAFRDDGVPLPVLPDDVDIDGDDALRESLVHRGIVRRWAVAQLERRLARAYSAVPRG